ncbi:hypothetical protein OSB04_001277 [Centaurea solstitialis]|uniref:RRM domain-containing protein n=1 Tax=Centaurea solstitialis TaxID=347529 RepID=A0AA38WUV7_9ASTR|nr:hypothetical protein OSB04_001277 [Centaurea solstitialis]
MSFSRRSMYSPSPSPPHKRHVSRFRSSSRSRSYDASDIENPGNNLYVTGLSPRITKRDLEKHFSAEGKVEDVHLVMDPWTRESRGFGFVSMSNVKEAERCIKYLDGSVLEGRVITVEKARRRRGRTPTPGRYLGLRTVRGFFLPSQYSAVKHQLKKYGLMDLTRSAVRHRSPTYSPHSRSSSPPSERDRSRSRSYSRSSSGSPVGRRRSYTPVRYHRHRSRSYTPEDRYYRRSRYRSRSYSPEDRYYRRGRYHSRSFSPEDRYYRRGRHHSRSYSPEDHYYRRGRYHSRSYSPEDRYYRRGRYHSRSYSPEDRYYRRDRYRSRDYSADYGDYSPDYRGSFRSRSRRYGSVSRSVSSSPRRHYRSYSSSVSPVRSNSGSVSSRARSRSCSSSRSSSPNSGSISRSPGSGSPY